ncbi:hypothetical protein INT43_007603 [Umbelopsis isabellina]|uniref:Uncharacterized protein n=1 Tax=Mortierella isabellina TaxID=91625 RepID=A0A8H7UF05_MORIS|nr:hypothetical protein INT43_007603 [Umbelopsis isabellina]
MASSPSHGVTLPPISQLLPDSRWHHQPQRSVSSSPSSYTNKSSDFLRPPALVIPPPTNENQLLSPAASSHSPISPHSPTASPKHPRYLSPISPSLSPIEPSPQSSEPRRPSGDFHLQVPSFSWHRRSSDPPPLQHDHVEPKHQSPPPPPRMSLSPSRRSVEEEPARVNPILFTNTGEPILKRKRGRPPNLREPVWEGGWTFVTPTVWNITSASPMSTNEHEDTETTTAFTSSTMDTVLTMPKKKRGRKPKTHIEGNSCFVWRDLTASGQRKVKAKAADAAIADAAAAAAASTSTTSPKSPED